MKLLIVLLAVLAGVWLWRQRRSVPPPGASTRSSRPAAPQEMAQCAHCGLHLPRDEALAGRHGVYCSAAHRQQAEG